MKRHLICAVLFAGLSAHAFARDTVEKRHRSVRRRKGPPVADRLLTPPPASTAPRNS